MAINLVVLAIGFGIDKVTDKVIRLYCSINQYLQWVFPHNQRVLIPKTTAKTTKFIATLFLVASLD